MNHRERCMAVLRSPPDRIPWYPRLEVWYEAHRRTGTLPKKYGGRSLREIERDLGVGSPARESEVFRTEIRDVEIRTQSGDTKRLPNTRPRWGPSPPYCGIRRNWSASAYAARRKRTSNQEAQRTTRSSNI